MLLRNVQPVRNLVDSRIHLVSALPLELLLQRGVPFQQLLQLVGIPRAIGVGHLLLQFLHAGTAVRQLAESEAQHIEHRVIVQSLRDLGHVADLRIPFYGQLSLIGLCQPGKQPHQGRLAAAVAADQGNLVSFHDFKRNAVQHQMCSVILGQLLRANHHHC
ncbi:hypothetical protein D1872_276630 [compost metagenome]